MGDAKLPSLSHVLLGIAALSAVGSAGWFIYRGSTLENLYQKVSAKSANEAAERARVEMKRNCGSLATPQKNGCDSQTGNAYRSHLTEIRDLEAQRTTALWTAYMGAAALLGIAVSITGVGLVYLTFQASRRAADAARDTYNAFIAVERASLVVEVTGGGEKNDQIMLGLRVSNIGRSSAHLWHVRFAAMTDNYPLDEFKGYHRIAQSIKRDETLHFVRAISVPGDLSKAFVGGYVEYRTAFRTPHKAYFCARIEYTDWKARGIVGPPPYSAVEQCRDENYWPMDT
jgi:hypothetical protein